MDYTDPKAWKDSMEVVINNLHSVVPIMVLVGGAAWWFKGSLEKSAKSSLKEKNDVLKERHIVLEERLRLAKDSESSVSRAFTELQLEIEKLKTEVANKVPDISEIERSTVSLTTTSSAGARASAALSKILSADTPLPLKINNIDN